MWCNSFSRFIRNAFAFFSLFLFWFKLLCIHSSLRDCSFRKKKKKKKKKICAKKIWKLLGILLKIYEDTVLIIFSLLFLFFIVMKKNARYTGACARAEGGARGDKSFLPECTFILSALSLTPLTHPRPSSLFFAGIYREGQQREASCNNEKIPWSHISYPVLYNCSAA